MANKGEDEHITASQLVKKKKRNYTSWVHVYGGVGVSHLVNRDHERLLFEGTPGAAKARLLCCCTNLLCSR